MVQDEPLTVSVEVNPPCATVPAVWHPQDTSPALSVEEQHTIVLLATLPLLPQAPRAQIERAKKQETVRIAFSPRGKPYPTRCD
jgi:hypothetical protein